jgi:hypothetical protein
MNSISPKSVAQLICDEFDYFNPPVSLSSTILEFSSKLEKQISELALTEDILGQDLQKYVSALVGKQQEISNKGLFCPYEVIPDSDEIVGFSYPRSTDTPIMQRIRRVASEIPEALKAIRELEPGKFELFCSKVLDLLNAEEVIKTKDSKDEGIDFLGWLCIPESFANIETIPQFRKEFRMLVIGQAKRYKPENPVGVGYIRELIGTVAAFHHDQLAPWESRLQLSSFSLMSPILPLMMTTGRISGDARLLAKKCGVVVRDGAEIALFICLEGVGIAEIDQDGFSRLKFDRQKFLEWLS